MFPEQTDRPSRSIPAWLVPWCIPLLLVLCVVSGAVSPFLMLVPAAVALGAAARWRYLEVRQRELRGVHEWERWRTDAVLRRAAEKYSDRG